MSAWAKFRQWRRTRPFWGGLFLLLSGVELYLSGNLTLKNIEIHIGQQGFLIYLLPVIMLLCGLLVWFSPTQRLFYGIIGLLTALYSFLGLNLGGFFIGMLLGILGGALVIAWGPPRAPKPAGDSDALDSDALDSDALDQTPGDEDAETRPRPYGTAPHPATEVLPYPPEPGTAALVRPYATEPGARPHAEDPETSILPGFPDQPEPPAPRRGNGRGDGGVHRTTLVITLAPLLLAVGALALGHATPAQAETACPASSAPATPSTSTPRTSTPRTSTPRTTTPRTTTPGKARTPAAKVPTGKSAKSATPTPAPSASESTGSGNPLVDGWNDLVNGIGHLLGVPGSDPNPSVTPTPASPSASATPKPKPTLTAAPGGGTATTPASGPASATPSPSASDIPCLGPRLYNKKASATGLTQSSLQGGLLEGDKLTMIKSTYDGVVDLPTADGTVKVLKFTMSSAITEPFKLTVAEPGGHITVITSTKLTIKDDDDQRDVEFYTPRFQGNLLLLGIPIPVVFTPDQPPPLTLDRLDFSNVKINLAYVSSKVLTAEKMKIVEN